MISTHTLTWSVTFALQTFSNPIQNFNSHAHVERDFYGTETKRTVYSISTHTLTWSVTWGLSRTEILRDISTHTLTWSVTLALPIFVYWISDFNSHAHVERDENVIKDKFSCFISTHTLTWSVTCIIDKTIRFVKFQLTRSRGA